LTRGAEDVAWEHGYNVLLCNTVEKEEREKTALHLLEETRVDGVILCSLRMCEEALFPLLRSFRSVVLVNRLAPPDMAGVVRTDDFEGGFIATQHMLKIGRRKIAFLAGPQNSFSGSERLRGSLAAMDAAGIQICPSMCLHSPPKRQAGYEVALELLRVHPEVNGLVCYNDLIAVGALQACTELHRSVPDDVALIGFDDIVLSRVVCPPLTTMGVSKVSMGAAAARMLLERLQGDQTQEEIKLRPNLIIRGSTP
jgi:LacI family transcriptional regulator